MSADADDPEAEDTAAREHAGPADEVAPSAEAGTDQTERESLPEVPTEDKPDATTPEAESPREAPSADDGRGRTGARKWLVPAGAALAVAVLALAVVIVVFAVKLVSAQADESGRADALAAARQAAVNLTTFNFQTAVEDVQRLQATTTAHFQQQFNQDQNAFIKLIRDSQVRTTGTATEAGVVTYQNQSARVLVAIKASVRNTSLQQPEKRDYRMAIDMVEQNGKWLADSVEFIP